MLAGGAGHLVVAGTPERIGEPVKPEAQLIVARKQLVHTLGRVLQFVLSLHNRRQLDTALL